MSSTGWLRSWVHPAKGMNRVLDLRVMRTAAANLGFN